MRRSAVTVSTVGVIPRIRQLVQDLPGVSMWINKHGAMYTIDVHTNIHTLLGSTGVSLALSLHAPNQELRKELVPSARAYKLDKLMDAIHEFQDNPDNPNPKV